MTRSDNFKFKNNFDKPLLLWCSSHETLAKEEIPLLLEAGFRVIPLLTNMWIMKHDEALDGIMCQDWKKTVGLDDNTVREIQGCRVFETSPKTQLTTREAELLNSHVDVIYVTVMPNVAGYMAEKIKAAVIFRAFGHGDIQTYSNISQALGFSTKRFLSLPNYIWCPILRTLMEPEDAEICKNPVYLRAFVSPGRLGESRWTAAKSKPYVIDTIPRITTPYYTQMYSRYIKDFEDLPLKILGGNSPGGGDLADPRIVGRLADDDYHRLISSARVSIYHGQSRYHLHYHPIEFMFIGVPVLFHHNSVLAAELANHGIGQVEAKSFGMYETVEEAKTRALQMLEDPSIAEELSARQSFFRERVFTRAKALEEARWLRTVCEAQSRWAVGAHAETVPALYRRKMQESQASGEVPNPEGKKPSLIYRIGRKAKRILKGLWKKPEA